MMLRGKSRAVVIVVALFVVFVAFPLPCLAYAGKVVNVDGGDLLTVSVNGSVRKIRLYGIGCPLFGQPFHGKAMFMTKFLSLQRDVEITPVFRDNYGVENALVRIDGSAEYLNEKLVEYGLAWVKPCDRKSHLCREWKKLEGVAQMNFIGLWAQPPAIAPWDWEKAKRLRILDRMKAAEKRK
ncbi:MAG: thermonuclease family protein [Deltaproteobacteria bacterium]|nr:thermonuclease family protein [Deltaproteobacteria bacterium]